MSKRPFASLLEELAAEHASLTSEGPTQNGSTPADCVDLTADSEGEGAGVAQTTPASQRASQATKDTRMGSPPSESTDSSSDGEDLSPSPSLAKRLAMQQAHRKAARPSSARPFTPAAAATPVGSNDRERPSCKVRRPSMAGSPMRGRRMMMMSQQQQDQARRQGVSQGHQLPMEQQQQQQQQQEQEQWQQQKQQRQQEQQQQRQQEQEQRRRLPQQEQEQEQRKQQQQQEQEQRQQQHSGARAKLLPSFRAVALKSEAEERRVEKRAGRPRFELASPLIRPSSQNSNGAHQSTDEGARQPHTPLSANVPTHTCPPAHSPPPHSHAPQPRPPTAVATAAVAKQKHTERSDRAEQRREQAYEGVQQARQQQQQKLGAVVQRMSAQHSQRRDALVQQQQQQQQQQQREEGGDSPSRGPGGNAGCLDTQQVGREGAEGEARASAGEQAVDDTDTQMWHDACEPEQPGTVGGERGGVDAGGTDAVTAAAALPPASPPPGSPDPASPQPVFTPSSAAPAPAATAGAALTDGAAAAAPPPPQGPAAPAAPTAPPAPPAREPEPAAAPSFEAVGAQEFMPSPADILAQQQQQQQSKRERKGLLGRLLSTLASGKKRSHPAPAGPTATHQEGEAASAKRARTQSPLPSGVAIGGAEGAASAHAEAAQGAGAPARTAAAPAPAPAAPGPPSPSYSPSPSPSPPPPPPEAGADGNTTGGGVAGGLPAATPTPPPPAPHATQAAGVATAKAVPQSAADVGVAKLSSLVRDSARRCGLSEPATATPEDLSQLKHHATSILSAAHHEGGEGSMSAAHARMERIVRDALLVVSAAQQQSPNSGLPSLARVVAEAFQVESWRLCGLPAPQPLWAEDIDIIDAIPHIMKELRNRGHTSTIHMGAVEAVCSQVTQLMGSQAALEPASKSAGPTATRLERVLLDVFTHPSYPSASSSVPTLTSIVAMAVAKHTKPSAWRLLGLMEDCKRVMAGEHEHV